MNYRSGLFRSCRRTTMNHGVLVIGYDIDYRGRDYWIVKNSWGSDWGDEGYIWIPRSESGIGDCGIA